MHHTHHIHTPTLCSCMPQLKALRYADWLASVRFKPFPLEHKHAASCSHIQSLTIAILAATLPPTTSYPPPLPQPDTFVSVNNYDPPPAPELALVSGGVGKRLSCQSSIT